MPAMRRTFRPTLEALEGRWVPSTLTVSNTLDSGAGSLRAEIAAAHNGDAITFASSLDGQTITLTGGELLISKNLIISGPADRSVTVSGSPANPSRVFEIAKITKNVTLSGLTICNGKADGGGGVLNGGTLSIRNCALVANTATNGGGAINSDGTLTITGSALTNNTAPYGGGLYVAGTVSLTNCTLSGNTASNSGGGIYTTNAYNNPADVTLNATTLSGNSAYSGGGIYDGAGALKVTNGSALLDNSAKFGGGIYNYHGTLTVSASNLTGNSASNRGGGIYVAPFNGLNNTVTVANSSAITGNSAPAGFGADVYNAGVLHLDASSIIGILDGNPPS
jgi:parallel beta-helix repeat protein/predicted outer membrane repeat protein